jgi:hypothetical protein
MGLSPYLQGRLTLLGDDDGRGFQLGMAAIYKFVGFEGDPGETEVALSGQYRQRRFELGLQGVVGKDFTSPDADTELHAYAVYRVIPELALGVAGQVRTALVLQPGENTYDVASGAIASLTLGRWQVAGLLAETTGRVNQGQVAALGELFATARFR